MLIYRCLDKFGMGDTIRSIYAFFVFCNKNEIPFLLYLKDSKLNDYIIDSFTKYKKLEELYLKDADGNILDLDSEKIPKTEYFIDVNGNLNKFLSDIKDDVGGMYVVCSNLFDFVSFDDLSDYKYKRLFLSFLEFKKPVLDKVNKLYNTLEDDFTAIHIRCGDKYMNKVNCVSDSRLAPNKAFSKITKLLKLLKKKYGVETRIFTDNDYVKTRFIKNTFDTKIGHVVVTDDTDEILDSLVEFILLGFAVVTVTLTNSGFSFWSSLIYNVPLYTYDDETDTLKEFLTKDLKY